jgi:hypothetical protein
MAVAYHVAFMTEWQPIAVLGRLQGLRSERTKGEPVARK